MALSRLLRNFASCPHVNKWQFGYSYKWYIVNIILYVQCLNGSLTGEATTTERGSLTNGQINQ